MPVLDRVWEPKIYEVSQYYHFKTAGQQKHFGIKNEQVTDRDKVFWDVILC